MEAQGGSRVRVSGGVLGPLSLHDIKWLRNQVVNTKTETESDKLTKERVYAYLESIIKQETTVGTVI